MDDDDDDALDDGWMMAEGKEPCLAQKYTNIFVRYSQYFSRRQTYQENLSPVTEESCEYDPLVALFDDENVKKRSIFVGLGL